MRVFIKPIQSEYPYPRFHVVTRPDRDTNLSQETDDDFDTVQP